MTASHIHDAHRLVSEALDLTARVDVALDHGLLQRVRAQTRGPKREQDPTASTALQLDPAREDLKKIASLSARLYETADALAAIAERYPEAC